MTDRTLHPRFVGRDAKGKWLPGQAWKLAHPFPPRTGWHPVPRHTKRCRECGSPFVGIARQRYCSKSCSERAFSRRRRTINSLTSKHGLRALSPDQIKVLPVFNRPDNRDQRKDSWWKLPAPGQGLLVPKTNVVDDRLARLLAYRLFDLDQVLELGLFKKPERVILGPDGEPMLLSKHEVLLVDALVLGLNVMLLKLKGKQPVVKPTLPAKLRRSLRERQRAKQESTAVPSADVKPKTGGNGHDTQGSEHH